MTWIDDNKGSGPWNFTEQPQKLGYINNPNFTEEATPTHSPCGYWFKNYVEAAQVNSYVYTDATVFGYNVLGVLGLYNFILQRSPVSQPYFPKIKYVSLGNKHAHIIDSNNQLWAVGADYYGSLGAGTLNQHKHHIIQIGTIHLLKLEQKHGLTLKQIPSGHMRLTQKVNYGDADMMG